MSVGAKLKKDLGLDKLSNVLIGRMLNSPLKVYMVVYDTRWPRSPITNHMMKRWPYAGMIYRDPKEGRPQFTPFVDIELFNGVVQGSYFFAVDLGGRFSDRKMLTKKIESRDESPKETGFLAQFSTLEEGLRSLDEEGFTVADFKKNAASDRNKEFLTLRRRDGEPGSFLKSATFNKRLNTLLLQFDSNITYDPKAGITTKGFNGGSKGNYKPHSKMASKYRVQVQFEEVEKHVGTLPEFLELSKGEQVAFIREMIKTCPVKVHSNDKSWYWQGAWENADYLGYAIHPFKGTSGNGIWSKRHQGESPAIYITKHILEVMSVIPFLAADIAKMIREKYS